MHNFSISLGSFAPNSSIENSSEIVVFKKDRGNPIRLLWFPTDLLQLNFFEKIWCIKSLVVVFPLEPVIPKIVELVNDLQLLANFTMVSWPLLLKIILRLLFLYWLKQQIDFS